MHRTLALSAIVAPLVAWVALSAPLGQQRVAAPSPKAAQAAGLPLVFEANGGRTDPRARFIAHGGGYTLFVTPRESVMTLGRGDAVLRTRLVGARPARVEGVDRLRGKVNSLVGPRSRWRTGIPTFARVAAHGVYPGVDLVYHGKQGRLEYDMQVAPGADPAQIRLAVSGARTLRLDDNGDLLILTKAGVLRQHRPVALQGTRSVPASFVLDGGQVSFRLGHYDPARPLVIDPQISYAGVYGGDQFDTAKSVAVDSAGSPYIAGNSASSSFPTANAIQGSKSTFDDAFVMKLTPDGTSQVYSTYLGGAADDRGNAIAVDSTGHAYVAGEGGPGIAATTTLGPGGADAWIAKLNPQGSGFDYVTAIGGNGGDHLHGIAVDGSNQVYAGGYTTSTNFPGSGSNAGGEDGIVFELNAAGTATLFSRYIGGTGNDRVYGIDQRGGETYIAGSTASTTFPTTAGAVQATEPNDNGRDGFAAKLAATGTAVWSTYVGGTDQAPAGGGIGVEDNLSDIAVTPDGKAWVIGYGESDSRPTIGLASEPSGYADVYIARISADGHNYDVSGYYGGDNYEASAEEPLVSGVATDAQGNGYFTSSTQSENFPGAHDSNLQPDGGSGGNVDAVVFKLTASGTAPTKVFSTYLGGENGGESGYEIASSPSDGAVWVVGGSSSSDFPKVASTRTPETNSDAMVVKYGISPATITDGPADGSTITSPTPSFSFNSPESLATYQCRTDSDAFAACTSPSTTPQLGDGSHTFDVRPLDLGGTPGPVARRSFTVDTQLRARLTLAPNPVLAGNPTTLDASESTDGLAITRYEWDIDGNGTFDLDTGTTPKTTQTYLTPGVVRNLAVRLTDAGGRTGTATGDLTVTARPTTLAPFGVSINKGAQYTNDPDVKITANFPLTTSSILVSNDGGFGAAKTFGPLATIPWKLDSSGPERLPKTVYVRFLPSAIAGLTFQDDIILDETPPKMQAASVAPASAAAATATAARKPKLRKWKVRVKASDSNSGVAGIQATSNKRKPGKLVKYKRKLTVKSAKRPKYVRAKDRAGNYSRWRKAQ
jgi:hypothetical protein